MLGLKLVKRGRVGPSILGDEHFNAVPAVRTSRLERPDAAFLELAATRVVSVPLERSDLPPLRRRAPHRARDRAAARQAHPDGPVRALRRGPSTARTGQAGQLMCGIVGYTGRREATPMLLEGLKRLEYRGYDSAGVAVANGRGVVVTKLAGRVAALTDELGREPLHGATGIAHTPW